ncbi:MAG: TetR/AcrR family transcriptional regulator [Henriciella sp.]
MPDDKEAKSAASRRGIDSRLAILDATRTVLIENGWRKFSVDEVARQAHASKQTIYRRWPAIGVMCVESCLTEIKKPGRDSGDPIDRIVNLLEPLELITRTSSGYELLRGALVAAADDSHAGEFLRGWIRENLRAPLRLILAEIASKKVIRRDFNLDEAIDTLTSPIWARLLIFHAPLPENYSRSRAARLLADLADH